MKKLYAVAAMAVMLCLAGFVMPGVTFAQQCLDNGDGTVTDYNSRLMWQKNISAGNWTRANHTADITIGGHSDWRLPSKGELINLYNSVCKSMMVVKNEGYWSSDSYNDSAAWVVDFSNGSMRYEVVFNNHFIRFVRNAHSNTKSNTKVIRKF